MATLDERIERLRSRYAEADVEVRAAVADKVSQHRQALDAYHDAEVRWLLSPVDADARRAADEARQALGNSRSGLTQLLNAKLDDRDAELDAEWDSVSAPDWEPSSTDVGTP